MHPTFRNTQLVEANDDKHKPHAHREKASTGEYDE